MATVQQFDLLKKSAITDIQTDLEAAVEADRLLAQTAATTATTKAGEASGYATTATTKATEAGNSANAAASAYAELPNAEHAIADIVAHLEGRIKTLEKLLVASHYKTIKVKDISVVEHVKLKGADTNLYGTGAPIVTPDFAGQEYLHQTAKIWYDAVGIVNAGDWKPRTNA